MNRKRLLVVRFNSLNANKMITLSDKIPDVLFKKDCGSVWPPKKDSRYPSKFANARLSNKCFVLALHFIMHVAGMLDATVMSLLDAIVDEIQKHCGDNMPTISYEDKTLRAELHLQSTPSTYKRTVPMKSIDNLLKDHAKVLLLVYDEDRLCLSLGDPNGVPLYMFHYRQQNHFVALVQPELEGPTTPPIRPVLSLAQQARAASASASAAAAAAASASAAAKRDLDTMYARRGAAMMKANGFMKKYNDLVEKKRQKQEARDHEYAWEIASPEGSIKQQFHHNNGIVFEDEMKKLKIVVSASYVMLDVACKELSRINKEIDDHLFAVKIASLVS